MQIKLFDAPKDTSFNSTAKDNSYSTYIPSKNNDIAMNNNYRKLTMTSLNNTITDPNIIFVFGSNEAGIHKAGAAAHAVKYFDAQEGVGSGITGRAYAIPTKDRQLVPLDLAIIEDYIVTFIRYAMDHPEKTFLFTAIGCGYAGYTIDEVAALIYNLSLKFPENVFVSSRFMYFDEN